MVLDLPLWPVMSDKGETSRAKRSQKFARSRNGCDTCKRHRRKCDESRPECNSCVVRHIPCPGYQKLFKWSSKYQQPEDQWQPKKRMPKPQGNPASSLRIIADESNSLMQADQRNPSAEARGDPSQEVVLDDDAFLEAPLQTLDSSLARPINGAPYIDIPQFAIPRHAFSGDEEENTAEDKNISTVSSHSRLPEHNQVSNESRDLLRRFYGLSQIAPRNPTHRGTVLIEHYFGEVCGLYSTFDSTLNPFRSNVARTWGGSAPVYYAIQSMAAAHLSNSYAEMERVGLEMKKQADSALQQELRLVQAGQRNADCVLMATLLLGLSACWHSVGDLGLPYLQIARLLIYPLLSGPADDNGERSAQNQFFFEAMIYWEMITSFVTSAEDSKISNLERAPLDDTPTSPATRANQRILPHPWTGIGSKAQMLFAETARLVRSERTDRFHNLYDTDADIMSLVGREFRAMKLEEQLLSLEPPAASTVLDHGDHRTSKEDFIIIAEATKFAALLELYQVFPSILRKRLQLKDHGELEADDKEVKTAETEFLNSLAIHTLKLVGQLDHNSGTRFLQLSIIVIAATKLRSVPRNVNLDFYDVHSQCTDEVTTSKEFAVERLNAHISRLPAKPVKRCLELIKEVWRLLDQGEDAFWLDVMIAHGWETIMG